MWGRGSMHYAINNTQFPIPYELTALLAREYHGKSVRVITAVGNSLF